MKKKLSKNVPLCTAILIIVALLAIPLLGGLKLSSAYRSAEKTFEKAVTTADKHGKDLYTDTDDVISAAESILSKGNALMSGKANSVFEKRADQLETAIDACSGAKTAIERYRTYENVATSAKLFVNTFSGDELAELNGLMGEIDSQSARIRRSYRDAYNEFTGSADKLLSAFPAKAIAGLFKIGGER